MKLKTDVCLPLLFAIFSVVLVGCGGGDSGGVSGEDGIGDSGVIDDIGVVSAAHSIVLTAPNNNAILDESQGRYSKRVSAMVNDVHGHPVPDGTVVNLNVIDSILAAGIIDTAGGADSLTGSTLTDWAPTTADGTTATQFDSAFVWRNASKRFIQSSDHVLLINADEEDKVRVVGGAALSNNTITTSSNFASAYPNAIYPASTTEYVVGASLLGTGVYGVDSDNNPITGKSTTVDGLAHFRISYPANENTIHIGCNPASDYRYLPYGSANIYLVASVSNSVTTVNNEFCLSHIVGGTLSVSPSAVSGNGAINIELYVEDGGDGVPLALMPIRGTVVTDGAVSVSLSAGSYLHYGVSTALSAGNYLANRYGYANSTLTISGGVSGDTATVTYSSGSGMVGTVAITIP